MLHAHEREHSGRERLAQKVIAKAGVTKMESARGFRDFTDFNKGQ